MAVHAQFYIDNLPFPDAVPFITTPSSTDFFTADASSLLSFSKNPHRTALSAPAFSQSHRLEIDHYIQLQNERLRMALREQGKQQIATLMKKIEFRTAVIFKQKEEEIARATKKTMELQVFMTKLETENQLWQRIAQENEAIALSLNNKLDQMRQQVSNSCDDAESCCDMNPRTTAAAAEEQIPARNGGGNCSVSEEQKQRKMICRGCNVRNSTVIFLPCRHLSSCKNCESDLDLCPVCSTGKKAIIEALIF